MTVADKIWASGELARRLDAIQSASVCARDVRVIETMLGRCEDKLLRILRPMGRKL